MNKIWNRTLVWLRRDLRLYDNTALSLASTHSDQIALCFVFDTNILDKLYDKDDRRITFIYESLQELDKKLRQRGSILMVRYGDPMQEIPKLAKECDFDAVYCNHDYAQYAKERDEEVRASLQVENIVFETFKDQVVFEGKEVVTNQGGVYKVFTPYRKAWLRKFGTGVEISEVKVNLSHLVRSEEVKSHSIDLNLETIGFKRSEIWLKPGEEAGRTRLKSFLNRIDRYGEERDYPGIDDATSGLSVHLRFGTVSIRECLREATKQTSEGAEKWISELIWREFYQMILDQFPYVETGAFKREYDNLTWEGTEEYFNAWCEGRTGFPIVDAAMRHFNKTGWMHNRLRMIVAMFLTKDLLVHWKKGERYFARYLLDYDKAANNGGWQWCASTGVDAQPYFRVFNPVLQSKKFDPEGSYIREHIPELKAYSSKHIHFPSEASDMEQQAAGCIIGKDYPKPIVSHAAQKEKAIEMFRSS